MKLRLVLSGGSLKIDKLSVLIDKKEGFSSLSLTEQTKYLAYFFCRITGTSTFSPKNVVRVFEEAHLPTPSNMSVVFSSLQNNRIFLRQREGYAIHRDVLEKLDQEFRKTPRTFSQAPLLRSQVGNVTNRNRRSFLNEAILCYECRAYRASIILTWIMTLDHLYDYIIKHALSAFNKELASKSHKITNIRTKDDFTDLKESIFIEICRSAKIITNDEKKLLDEKLGVRNSCSHPNTIVVPESKAASFIEDLIHNIVLKYPL
jgi:hypothetical protein